MKGRLYLCKIEKKSLKLYFEWNKLHIPWQSYTLLLSRKFWYEWPIIVNIFHLANPISFFKICLSNTLNKCYSANPSSKVSIWYQNIHILDILDGTAMICNLCLMVLLSSLFILTGPKLVSLYMRETISI